jgi:hypothetical protein
VLWRLVVASSLAVLVVDMHVTSSTAQTSSFKVAYYNIQSGKGEPPLPGRRQTFVDTSNCTDRTQPLNAWGVGIVQRELERLAGDASIVALGLGEAWTCASASRVQAVLGWRAISSTRNGVALVARYGFSGDEVWRQLDTSLNPNPADTMWVLRQRICLDEGCTRTFPLMVAHWYAAFDDPDGTTSLDRQAAQTVDFMRQLGSESHVLIGDLNAWEAPQGVCGQLPLSAGLNRLRAAGYLDAWPLLHPNDPGFTGMLNRVRCGTPEGAAWKRIDYAWSTPDLPPIAMQRFGLVPAGEEAPSDHYGIVAEYAGSPATESSGPPPNGVPGTGDIVVQAAQAIVAGRRWRATADAQAASGEALETVNLGEPKRAAGSAVPADYVEATISVQQGVPYRIWIRGKAAADHWSNDSLFVQFSGSVDQTRSPMWRIDTTSAAAVSLERCSGCGLRGWGWGDNGYGAPGRPVYFDGAGTQTIRIQLREDGLRFDQVLLSPQRYLTTAPGLAKDDRTIFPHRP